MSENNEQTDGQIHHIALAMKGDDVLEFMSRIHKMAFVRGCYAGYRDAIHSAGEKIKGLEEELAGKSKNDPYVMGEISALAQFAAHLKIGADDADEAAVASLEALAEWCKGNDLSPLLAVFAHAIHKRGEAAQ